MPPRPMRRVVLAAVASVVLYAAAFGLWLDRPLSLGALRQRLDAAIARGATIQAPKLVILAGSNGPYSHRCEAMEPILHRPCVNAGVAVGIGLDYLFARWRPLLRPGDVVYLPLEQEQYSRARPAITLGPDAAIMLRHDRATLAQLPWDRWAGALFAFDLRALVMSGIEMALHAGGFTDPRARVTGTVNAWGDQVGHTPALAAASAGVLAAARPVQQSAAAITRGAGSAEVIRFLDWAAAAGVQVVGGLSTGFADVPIPPATLAAIRALYEAHGAGFLDLPNQARYARTCFFDTPDHLHEQAQRTHAALVAHALVDQGWVPDGQAAPAELTKGK